MDCSRETGGIFFEFVECETEVIRFKAGSELSSSVNCMDVNVNEDLTDIHEILQISQRSALKKVKFNPSWAKSPRQKKMLWKI